MTLRTTASKSRTMRTLGARGEASALLRKAKILRSERCRRERRNRSVRRRKMRRGLAKVGVCAQLARKKLAVSFSEQTFTSLLEGVERRQIRVAISSIIFAIKFRYNHIIRVAILFTQPIK